MRLILATILIFSLLSPVIAGEMYFFNDYLAATQGNNPYETGPSNPGDLVPRTPVVPPEEPTSLGNSIWSDAFNSRSEDELHGSWGLGLSSYSLGSYALAGQFMTVQGNIHIDRQTSNAVHKVSGLTAWVLADRRQARRRQHGKSKTIRKLGKRGRRVKEVANRTLWFCNKASAWKEEDRFRSTQKVRATLGGHLAGCRQILQAAYATVFDTGWADYQNDTSAGTFAVAQSLATVA